MGVKTSKKDFVLERIGSDPEFAIFNKSTSKYVASYQLIPGDKENHYDIGNGCSCHKDNVSVEVNIPPSKNVKEFTKYIIYCKTYLSKYLESKNKDLVLKAKSSAYYTNDELDNPCSCEFGCEPSYNVYSDQSIEPEPIENYRTFGFHVHMGFDRKLFITDIENIIRCLDLYLGVPTMFIDTDNIRRNSKYGVAGDFRFNCINDKHVVEYRVLGGALLKDVHSIALVGKTVVDVVNNYINGKYDMDKIKKNEKTIKIAINNNNMVSATHLMDKFRIKHLMKKQLILQ